MQEEMSLKGYWSYYLDEKSRVYENTGFQRIEDGVEENIPAEEFVKDGFYLPGSTCDNHIGKKQEYFASFCKEAIRAPREKWEYIGKIWLQKKVVIPKEWENKKVSLFLERVSMASQLWIDGKKQGRQIITLSTPHIYELSKIEAGEHTLTLCIDNRNLINCDYMASGYSIDTQGYWNGVIGEIKLIAKEVFRIEDVTVYPKKDKIRLKVVETSDVHTPCITKKVTTTIFVETPDQRIMAKKSFPHEIYQPKQVSFYDYEIPSPVCWSEFTPALYQVHVCMEYEGRLDEKTVSFGMRTMERKEKTLLLNEKPLSLRGTIHCAIFPLTGYPDMDKETWKKHFKTLKEYGLNHVRFHAWCPPDAAFLAADEVGIYLGVEMPFWLNHDCCALEVGEDSIQRQYYLTEAMQISKTYGNHPSFILFSNGNELMGDFDLLNDITVSMRGYDPRRLYTLTSNFDHPVLPCEDYLAAFAAGGHKIRIQDLHDEVAKDTCLTYDKAVEDVSVPIISFETGQYCVYPDVDAIEKYTGNMLPVNLDVVKKSMLEKKVYDRREEYIKASGDLAVKLYKEDMEAVYRTHHMGGFQLLSLTDYTGQSTATVGILDAFFDSKGIITPKAFRHFCDAVVPLWKSKRIFDNEEIMEAELDLYDYGEEKIFSPVFEITITDGEKVIFQTSQKERKFQFALDQIKKASLLSVKVRVNEYENFWRVFVYPKKDSTDFTLLQTVDSGISLIGKEDFPRDKNGNLIEGSFIPVFWSPVHFPSMKPCGAIINREHEALKDFPTQRYSDYQWKNLLDHSVNADLTNIEGEIETIVEVVPNYCDNTVLSPLFIQKKDGKKTLYCGFDLTQEDLPTKQLKRSLLKYLQTNSI